MLQGTEGRHGYPRVRISVGKNIYFNDEIKNSQQIEFTVKEIKKRNVLSIEMIDKSSDDTVVKNGKIIKDKSLKIQKICMDNVDIKNYIYQGRQKPIYHKENQGPRINGTEHLFFNGPWKLFYKNPVTLFLAYYNGRGQKINSHEKQMLKNRYLERLNFLVKSNNK
jgi:hypothetical protein